MSPLNKFALILVLLYLNNVFAKFNQSEPRITNGTRARKGQFPYQVSLQYQNSFSFCGGSIVHPKHIVTAAHCVINQKPKNLKVWLGDVTLGNRGSNHSVKNIFVHEKYSDTSQDNDIAVLRLDKPITFNSNTNLINLPSGNVSQGTRCIVSGWGKILNIDGLPGSRNLMYANVPITNWTECRKRYYQDLKEPMNITTNMICAGDNEGHDSCQGDSGGPLACKINPYENKTSLVGIVSFGVGCGNPDFSGVYTNVYQYVDWINVQLKKNSAVSTSLYGMQPLAILISSIIYPILFH